MTTRAAGPVLLAAAAAAWAACAQPGSPPGGEVDRFPPRVVQVTPAPFDTIQDLSRPVVFQFDERLSQRLEGVRELQDAVLVSPRTGVVTVDRGRRSLEISLAGGWQPNQVYRVWVQPVFRDLFNNPRREPIELVFSTGAPIHETALAGFVRDRLTGEPVEGARVEAVRRIDNMLYQARTDSAGFFALRFVPAGAYDIRSWLDQDRDRTMEFTEIQDTAQAALAFGDTLVLELELLPGDSTAARLARAEPLDPLTVQLLFDDYFAPGPVDGAAQVIRFGDSTLVSRGELIHGSRLDSLQAARRPRTDTLPADSAPGDTVPSRARPPAAPGERPPAAGPAGVAGAVGAAGPALPARELILLLSQPLAYDSVYYVVVEDLTNVHGIPGGGGSARFQMPAAPPPDTAAPAADSLATPPDRVPATSPATPPDTVPSLLPRASAGR